MTVPVRVSVEVWPPRDVRSLMSSEQILAKCVRQSVSNSVGTRLSSLSMERIMVALHNSIHIEIATQVEMRGMSREVYVGEIRKIIQGVHCGFDGSAVNVSVDDGWFVRVDTILRNRVCRKCSFVVMSGDSHSEDDCRVLAVSDVMEA